MRTKTLLLTAVLGVAGIASSSAQVFSVNAVGYVNLSIPVGLSMIGNPLNTANNTIGSLLTVPAGTQIYKFNGTGFTSALYDDIDGWTSGGQPAANITLNPGEGIFIRNNGTQPIINTFVGEVMQGNLSVNLPAGLAIVGSQVPQQGKVSTDLGFPLIAGTQIYVYNGVGYDSYLYDDIDGWTKGGVPSEPTINVGQSFWVRNNGSATSWTRTFSVNN